MGNGFYGRVITGGMFEFERLCFSLEKLDRASFNKRFAEEYARSLDVLCRIIGKDADEARRTLMICAMVASMADGKFVSGEFSQIGAMIDAENGGSCTFEEAKEFVETELAGMDRDEYVRKTYLSIKEADPEAAESFIVYLTAVCCADGNACRKEKKWIKSICR